MNTRRGFLQVMALGTGLASSSIDAQEPHAGFARPERKWPAFTTRPVILARKGAVTSGHYLATAAGMKMLGMGGNAFDAAVAAGFASAVVEPQWWGIGGEVAMLGHSARDGRVWSISGQGPAPRRATIAWFRQQGIDAIPSTGLLPATVPAATSAWLRLLEKFGTLPVKEVLGPAIDLAENGFPVHSGVAGIATGAATYFPPAREAFHPNGRRLKIGELLRLPAWASTFKRLVMAADGAASREAGIAAAHQLFYKGDIARRVSQFGLTTLVKDSTGREHSALLEYEDLASYESPLEEPVTASYRGYQVYKCGPWTQGPVFLQHLKILEGFDLGKLGHNSADYIHTVVEAAKLAFADRDAFYGDPKFVRVPFDRLLSDSYADERRRLIDHRQASMEIRPGPGAPSVFVRRDGLAGFKDTTHLDAVDSEGNMVSATPSGGWVTMSPMIPDLGFALGVRGQMFYLDPRHPGSLQPGKRPRTTITPSLVMKDGKPLMVFGTLGGDMQDQWTLQFFLNYVDFGMNLQEAIDAPGFDTSHFYSSWSGHPASIGVMGVEGRVSPVVVEELKRRGHKVNVGGDWVNGRVLAAEIDHEHGVLRAAASPRAETGYAFGW